MMTFYSNDSKKIEVPILVEISNIAQQLKARYGPKSIQAIGICGVGFYLLFFGILTSKLSLSVVLSILVAYYAEYFADSFKDVDESSLGNGLFRSLYDNSQKLSQMVENDYFMLLLVCFLASCLLILISSAFKYILAFIAIYLFYNTYIDYFIEGDAKSKIFFCSATLLVLLIVLLLFSKLLKSFLIVLYSITGSLIFLVALEYVFGLKLAIVEMVEEMGHNFQLSLNPQGVGILLVFFIGGVCVQLFYIPSLPYI